MIRLLRAADYRRMPWKNGGGETREVLVSPPGASLDALEWRVSLATVASDGPFSEFRGITRTLSVIRGNGITLHVGPQVGYHVSKQLLPASEPYTFDGETPTTATLVDGPIVDLNVMTRRGAAGHRVTRLTLAGTSQIETSYDVDVALVFCRSGGVTCRTGGASVELREEDCALIEGPAAGNAADPVERNVPTPVARKRRAVELIAPSAADVFVIELYRELTSSGS